jgi:hypothetical protein
VVTTMTERSTRDDVPAREIARVFDDDFPSVIEVSPRSGDATAARRRSADVLVGIARGRRDLLEELRLGYLRRLHRASDDYEATQGLRVVEAALSLIPHPEEPGAEQHRTRQPRRRWWRRRGTR